MQYFATPGDMWLDLSGGSGSTLIARRVKPGRKSVPDELDPPYCDVIVDALPTCFTRQESDLGNARGRVANTRWRSRRNMR